MNKYFSDNTSLSKKFSDFSLLILGLGNQGTTWALNLRDQNFPFTIGLRQNSPHFEKAQELGLKTLNIDLEDLKPFSQIALLIPDHLHLDWLQNYSHHLKPGTLIILAHGYALQAHQLHRLFPKLQFALLAPKAIASEMRKRFVENSPISGAYGPSTLAKDNLEKIRIIAKNLGITHGPYLSSFEEEAMADLFSEQTLLCGTIPYLALEAYNQLRSAGVSKELAYLECWHELKLIVNAMVNLGPVEFFKAISPNALLGSEKARQLIVDDELKIKFKRLFSDIQSGQFQKEIDNSDFETIRNSCLERWQAEEFFQVHQDLKDLN